MWGSFFSGGKDPLKELGYEILADNQQTSTANARSIWTILNGKKKINGDLVTIFSCQNDAYISLAKTALKRMKTLRHPNILVYLDGVETDKAVYVVTEKAMSLETYLVDLKSNENQFHSQHLSEIAWGLYQLCRGLIFLHDDCKLSHGNVNTSTIFVDSKTCDWKLACFEFVQPITDSQMNMPTKYLPACQRYELPTTKSGENLKSRDVWLVGTLIWEIFNGNSASSSASFRALGSIPRTLSAAYGELINSNPNVRSSMEKFSQSTFIQNNSLVECLRFLEQIQLKDANEKQTFFTTLPDKVEQFSSTINEKKLLPLLFTAYEFGSAGSAVLPTLFKLGKRLSDVEYKKRIVPIITKLFALTDRMTRFRLLQQLDIYVEYLTPAVVNDDIFSHICTGFTDQEPAIREATVKAMLYLAPKLNYKNLNIELMKHFSRLQTSDDQGIIRTNTTVCLGKIAGHLNPSIRGRLLISAFGRGVQDTFGPSRQASLYALLHSEKFFTLKDIATKILPIACQATIDPELDVRQQAFKTINVFVKKLETVSEKPELAIEMEKEVNSSNITSSTNETSWTSWAITSLSSNIGKLTTKPQQPSVNLTLAKSDTQKTVKDDVNHSSTVVKTNISPKIDINKEKEEQEKQSAALAEYFNKTDNEQIEIPWGEMKTNDWGDSENIDEEDQWDDFNTSAQSTATALPPPPPPHSASLPSSSTTAKTSTGFNASAWAQNKPAAKTNDWDSDAFFENALSSTTKPKLKTARRS